MTTTDDTTELDLLIDAVRRHLTEATTVRRARVMAATLEQLLAERARRGQR